MSLTEFLVARIAEDEAVAQQWPERPVPPGAIDAHGHPIWGARSRVLAECEAKRRIVDLYQQNRDRTEANASEHERASTRSDLSALPALRSAGWDLNGRDWALEMTLRLLALPYADHPDYDPAWRS